MRIDQITNFKPITLSAPSVSVENEGKQFLSLLNEMTQTQNANQVATYNLITKGEGEASQVLISQMKAESQMKTAALVRDNIIENYKQLMNTQL
ncbi:flagellar hook-basal body complex protein FliE [Ectobacillus sp. JY-23]|uniref:flagellar hook-basal body complex protein FliE n=1 Tax=Ectobacillus sp. JY-23 TaxID=2933872 RepID=UPI001FF6CD6D|nr:flagellar hook-basal body complex protein FliE [Ectobacillus sp. JY-23]UOY93386.1 flagellar hook-basal body complex protein FliE [Ectobacillus sp. JY-23]